MIIIMLLVLALAGCIVGLACFNKLYHADSVIVAGIFLFGGCIGIISTAVGFIGTLFVIINPLMMGAY